MMVLNTMFLQLILVLTISSKYPDYNICISDTETFYFEYDTTKPISLPYETKFAPSESYINAVAITDNPDFSYDRVVLWNNYGYCLLVDSANTDTMFFAPLEYRSTGIIYDPDSGEETHLPLIVVRQVPNWIWKEATR